MNEWLYAVNYNDPTPIGVYAIVNVVNGRLYVGSTVDLTRRASQHWRALEDNLHHNRELQYSFTNHGPHAFTFIVLERCSEDQLMAVEQKWLNRLAKRAFNKQLRVMRPEERAALEEMPYLFKERNNPNE